jgi:hypothetical protein
MTTPGGHDGGSASGAEGEARERLAREAQATATALLDWVGTRVDDAAAARAEGGAGASRPRQSAGPCTWCPVCALVAALRGEQPELTATLAEQASGLLVLLRLLLSAHAGGAHDHHAPPAPGEPAPGQPSAGAPEVPWDVAPHATFDPEPAPVAPVPDDPRPAPERPTGKRGPRPSPRHQPSTAAAPAAPGTAPTPAVSPAADRSSRGVQRITVRRRPRPC